jgi:hypothetical protein
MAKYHKGVFVPKNPSKYIGNHSPVWRSSWELVFMNFCDSHSSVLQWASEPFGIKYKCPFSSSPKDRQVRQYFPDFFMQYIDQAGNIHMEVIEIKPLKESKMTESKSTRDRLANVKNQAKWQAANAYCEANGFKFRVLTERDIFSLGGKK